MTSSTGRRATAPSCSSARSCTDNKRGPLCGPSRVNPLPQVRRWDQTLRNPVGAGLPAKGCKAAPLFTYLRRALPAPAVGAGPLRRSA
ncbi:MAG: hypothetical protein EOP15_07345 [Pseudomonas sp.]|nr:MAG: hypothetical protein EOP15_07345 [Pseudomonas sp.]